MPAKTVELHERARVGIVKGATLVAEAARVTLGPKGRNVMIQKSFGAPTVTKDGVTVVKEIELENRFENMGAKLIREVAQKTSDVAGDGTTTATVLAGAIVREGIKLLAAGFPPMELKRGIEAAVVKAVATIKEMARPVKERERIEQVATISANGDKSIGKIVADAMDKVGKEGVITVEEARGLDTMLDLVEGMRFDRGYLSPYFVTNPDKLTVELDEPLILFHEKKISNLREIVPLLESVVQAGRPLLIHRGRRRERGAGGAGREQAARHDESRGGEGAGLRRSAQGNAAGHGDPDRRQSYRRGTGRQAREHGDRRSSANAKRVLIDKDNTTIVGGAGKKSEIQGRIELIRRQIEETTSDYDREKLQERLAKLTGGVAVIKVGAATEVELKEKKARVDDAVHALRAAVEEGIVPGGGVALVRAIKAVKSLRLNEERKAGAGIVAAAMSEPLKQIALNAGHEPEIVFNAVLEGKGDYGFNAGTEVYEDLVKAGVIDPAKVVRSALENAASAAVDAAHDRSCHCRSAEEARAADGYARRRRWNGRNGWRHGRHGWHGRLRRR